MLRDLRRIANGEILSTKIHRDFYAHEMREFARFRVKGFATKPVPPGAQSTIYRNAHYATLKEYGIPFEDHHKLLYTPFAQSVMFK